MDDNQCYVRVGKEKWKKAKFVGVYQNSNVIAPSPMIGGDSGGVVAYPVAVVIFESGEMSAEFVKDISFKIPKQKA